MIGEPIAMGMLKGVGLQVPFELAIGPVIVLQAGVTRLRQVIEEIHEPIFGDVNPAGRIDCVALGIEIPDALNLPGIAAAVVLNVHACHTDGFELPGSFRQE
jgi:hypothetical protein